MCNREFWLTQFDYTKKKSLRIQQNITTFS